MSNLEKIKQIAEQMPDSPEKQQGLQAYENLKLFETMADSFDAMIETPREKQVEKARQKAVATGKENDLKKYLEMRRQ